MSIFSYSTAQVKSIVAVDIINLRSYDNHKPHVAVLHRRFAMAKNPPVGDGHRVGAVRDRSQTQTPAGHWVKRDTGTGRFIDVKTTDKTPFKGVRKEK